LKKNISDADSAFNKCHYFYKERFLLGCAHLSADAEVEGDTGQGILANHAYGILNFKSIDPSATNLITQALEKTMSQEKRANLVKIRNPWGSHEWKGAWSDGSKEWNEATMKRLKHTFADDGTFWMEFSDFHQQFNNLVVCRLLSDQAGVRWQKHVFEGKWTKDSAGGCVNHSTWENNPQYALNVKGNNQIYLSLSQPDCRMWGERQYKDAIGFDVFNTDDSNVRKKSPTGQVGTVTYTTARDVSGPIFQLSEGQYVIVPTTFEPGVELRYWLYVYAKHSVECHPID